MEKFYKNFVNYMFKKTVTRWEIGTMWVILYILGRHYFKFEEGYGGVCRCFHWCSDFNFVYHVESPDQNSQGFFISAILFLTTTTTITFHFIHSSIK